MQLPNFKDSLQLSESVDGKASRFSIAGLQVNVISGVFAMSLLSACNTDDYSQVEGMDSGGVDSSAFSDAEGRDSGLEPDIEYIPDNLDWPSEGRSGDDIGRFLLSSFPDAEPSGLVFDADTDSYFVVSDDGRLFQLDASGQVLSDWSLGGDLEGLALDSVTRTLFLADEEGSAVRFWNMDAEDFVRGRACNLDLVVDGGKGFEALTFMPGEDVPENWGDYPDGLIFAGTQADTDLSPYSVADCVDGQNLSALNLGGIEFVTPNDDLSGAHYVPEADVFLTIHDDGNTLDVMGLDGSISRTYDLGSGGHEGVFLSVNCETGENVLTVAQDDGEIQVWDDFPISCNEGGQGVDMN